MRRLSEEEVLRILREDPDRSKKLDLREVEIESARFDHEDFSKADMSWGDFRAVSFEHCRFDHAVLDHAKFSDASFRGASFRDASLFGTDFRECCLADTDCDGDGFYGIHAERSRFIRSSPYRSNDSFQESLPAGGIFLRV